MQQLSCANADAVKSQSHRFYLYLCLASSSAIIITANIITPTIAISVSNFYFIACPLAVVFFSVVLLRKNGLHTHDGKLILLFTIYVSAAASAEILWIVEESVFHVDPLRSSADIAWFVGYAVLFAFFVMYLRPIRKSIPKNIRLLAMGLAAAFLIPAIFGTISLQDKTDESDLVMALMYPIVDSIMLYHVMLGLIFLYNGRKNEFFFLLLLAIICITISDTLFVTLSSIYHNGNLIDIGWVFGHLFLAFAVLSFKSLPKTEQFQNFFHVEGKNIVAPIRFETIVRFVIPFVVGVISIISLLVLVNDQYLDRIYNVDDNTSIDVYMTVGVLVSLSFVILFINHKLFYLVKSRTVELESERDVLKLQIREKNELLQKSNILEEQLEKTIWTLTVSEQKYRNIYDGSNDLYCTINCTGVIVDCNESFAKSLRYEKSTLIGKIMFDYLAEKSIYDMNMTFATWINTGNTIDREIWLERKGSDSFPTLLSMASLYDSNGNLVGSNITMKDITVQKTISDQLSSALTELRQTEKLKDEFLAMISHELKTPLVPIIGYCDLLSSEKLGSINAEQRKRLNVVRTSGVRLRGLINDILDVQKLELGQMTLNKQLCDVKDIVRDTFEDFMPALEEKRLTIKLNEKNETKCMCDKERIQQVLANMVRNSIDFCPSVDGRIIVHLSSDSKNAKIMVEDNGKGIPEDKLAKLFVKFYQIDTSTTRMHGGTGLGLSICKGIVESHGGRIWAESEGIGKGSRFYIELPLE